MILHLNRFGRYSSTLLRQRQQASYPCIKEKSCVNFDLQKYRFLHHLKNEGLFSKTLSSDSSPFDSNCKIHWKLNLQQFRIKTSQADHYKSFPQKIVEECPARLQPYLRLSRVHQPIGTWLLFWPCTWGLGLATQGIPDFRLWLLFGAGAFVMRSAGCTVNDMWDRQIDKNVIRTLNRPLASGELRMRHAALWLIFQLSLAFSILLQLNYPCFLIGVGSLGFVATYPLAKRVTNWPQAVLGSTFNIGVLMGFTAAAKYSHLGYLDFPWLDQSCLSLYLAGISWTLIYDTIYAHQDRNDDTTLGLGSTARRFGENTKLWLSGFSFVMATSLLSCGILSNLQWPYYVGVAGVVSHLAWQIKTLEIHNPQNCSERFKSNRHLGWILFLGILGSSMLSKESNAHISQDLRSATASASENKKYLSVASNPTAVANYTSQLNLKNS